MILRFAAVLVLLAGPVAAQTCRDGTVYLRGDWGSARFTVEIADDRSERAQGLMHRESMPASAGMLFIYPAPQSLSFWMRNTLIPLDMIFIDPQGIVRHIHHRAVPLDETPIPGGRGLTHVLEINGGMSKALGITVGSQVRHPSFEHSDAIWPC
ncbi:DUF192 domain-containing protein [uncultured Roseobacter sp.]|uniref:DUF192 domain-containing protein n=1 Tax=uncultured Roseobacter sp. TaxID=114847 RepID=UPI00262A5378|nr:DUF192 domain-containing protein [uncultured Roseobacter sp.]